MIIFKYLCETSTVRLSHTSQLITFADKLPIPTFFPLSYQRKYEQLIFSTAPPGLQLLSSTGTHNKIHKYPLASNYFMTARCRVRWREKRKKSSSNQTSLRDKIYSSYRKNQLNRVFSETEASCLWLFSWVISLHQAFVLSRWMNPRQIADKRRLFTVCSGTTAKTAWFPPFIVTDPPRHAVQILSYSKPRWLHTISIDNLFYCRLFFGCLERRKEKTIKVAFGASSIEEKNTKIVSLKLLLRLCFGLLMSSPHVGRASGIRGQHRLRFRCDWKQFK